MHKIMSSLVLFFCANLWATEDGAYLDPPYNDLIQPINDQVFLNFNKSNLSRSNVTDLIRKMTAVKSQGSRGTCSIFSATAMLEGMLVVKNYFSNTIDLSEEYLEYLVVRNRTSDGSNSSRNFAAIVKYGLPTEQTYPYISDSWVNSSWLPEVTDKCGHLQESKYESCLLIHRDPDLMDKNDSELLDENNKLFDPEFAAARKEAYSFKSEYIKVNTNWYGVYGVSEIKKLLDAGIPLTMGIPVYYGAWNHRLAESYEIGRDTKNWSLGIVGYPEFGSKDRKISEENRAGHSVLIVGYDDEKEVTTTVEMEDGTTKTFTYTGVYYFKNSWGTYSFGANFILDGVNYPGYGMITQKHAHEHGGFFQFPLN